MNNGETGFTLIELMIAVAIVGVLAAIAVPAYQDYTVREKLSEGLTLAAAAKTTVAEGYEADGLAGITTAADAWTFAPTKYVACITLNTGTGAVAVSLVPCVGAGIAGDPGAITVIFDTSPNGISQLAAAQDTITLTPSISHAVLSNGAQGNIEWACASASANTAGALPHRLGALRPKFAPTECK
jgi:type IV pilus assembly protein PilA